MSVATEWLMRQVDSSPAELIQMMLGGLPESAGETIPETLATGAMALYARVLAGAGGREDALALLAADALFTHAFQAQAELDPEGLAAYVARWIDGSRLAALLDDSDTPGS